MANSLQTEPNPTEQLDQPRTISRGRRWAFGLFALGATGLIAIVALEFGLRLARPHDRFFPYHVNAKHVFYPTPEVTPGVEGVSYFTTNSFGTRGPEPDDSKFRMLVIGGSTAACTALNDDEAWPYLLGQLINKHYAPQKALWVTNSGIDGMNTRNHIMHAKYLVPKIPELDFVLVYCGLNDVGLWLYQTEFDPQFLDDPDNWAHTIGRSFRVSDYVDADAPWFKRLELWKRASIIKAGFETARIARQQQEGVIVEDDRFEWLQQAAQRRTDLQKTFVAQAKMDTLDVALATYQGNLRQIISLCRDAGTEPILMAQFIQWLALDPEERRRLWMGAMDGGATYIREEQMTELVNRFNLAMKETADAEGVLYVDLPALLGDAKGLCYDGSHFNELGARRVAESLADFFIQQKLFAE